MQTTNKKSIESKRKKTANRCRSEVNERTLSIDLNRKNSNTGLLKKPKTYNTNRSKALIKFKSFRNKNQLFICKNNRLERLGLGKNVCKGSCPYTEHKLSDQRSCNQSSSAQTFIVFDLKNQKEIASKRSYQTRQIASLTKMMTAYLASIFIQKFKIQPSNVLLTASQAASSQPGTSAQIKKGQVYSIEQLLYGMLLPSGNDAAVLLAQYFGRMIYLTKSGRIKRVLQMQRVDLLCQQEKGLTKLYYKQFISKMNQVAKLLNMRHTQFMNPHGLTPFENRSSARDLVKLCQKFITVPLLLKICSSPHYYYVLKSQVNQSIRHFKNTNSLLDQNFMGIKTGMTQTAGGCLASLWVKQGRRVLIIVLGCIDQQSRFSETKQLLKSFVQN